MDNKVTIVSGLPRSGTSMMMQMLEACGLEILTDNIREADTDNPRGYYELECVKKIGEDASWLANAQGKAVKMISMLLSHLPSDYEFKIVFMLRNIEEVLLSQDKMMDRLNTSGAKLSQKEMANLYRRHLTQIQGWLEKQPNIEVLYLNYGDTLSDPDKVASQLVEFMGNSTPVQDIVATVDSSLYRNKVAKAG